MERIGISACAVQINFAGDHSTSGLRRYNQEQGNSTVQNNLSQAPSGNRIGHDPSKPRIFAIPEGHKRPTTIRETISHLIGSYSFPKKYKDLYYHQGKDGEFLRKMRSEARERDNIVLAALVHYYDAIREEIGFVDSKGGWVSLSDRTMASKCGMSLCRYKRALNSLRKKGFYRTIEQKQKDSSGNWTSNIARKFLTPMFFMKALGFKAWQKMKFLKDWVLKKQKPKGDEQKKNVEMLSSLIKNASVFSKTRHRNPASPKAKNLPANMKGRTDPNLIHKAYEMFKRDPSRSCGEYMRDLVSNTS